MIGRSRSRGPSRRRLAMDSTRPTPSGCRPTSGLTTWWSSSRLRPLWRPLGTQRKSLDAFVAQPSPRSASSSISRGISKSLARHTSSRRACNAAQSGGESGIGPVSRGVLRATAAAAFFNCLRSRFSRFACSRSRFWIVCGLRFATVPPLDGTAAGRTTAPPPQHPRRYATTVTFAACGPFSPCCGSYSTCAPSASDL
jgi:hypothetical protein